MVSPVCADTVANQIPSYIIFSLSLPVALSLSSRKASRGITAEGEQRDAFETLEIISTLICGQFLVETVQWAFVVGLSLVTAILSIAVSPI